MLLLSCNLFKIATFNANFEENIDFAYKISRLLCNLHTSLMPTV